MRYTKLGTDQFGILDLPFPGMIWSSPLELLWWTFLNSVIVRKIGTDQFGVLDLPLSGMACIFVVFDF